MKISIIGSMTVAIGLLSYPLAASSINVAAASTGCFSVLPTTCTVGASSATIGGLTFTGQSAISGVTEFNSTIGAFDLSAVPFDYNGRYFGLFLAFTVPDGEPNNDFTALVTGKINAQQNGDVRLTFDNPTITTLFNGADGSGSLTVSLGQTQYNLNAASGRTHAAITADISGTLTEVIQPSRATPEPGTFLLLGCGAALVTLGRLKRLRRTA